MTGLPYCTSFLALLNMIDKAVDKAHDLHVITNQTRRWSNPE
jgi:hypothetical protein